MRRILAASLTLAAFVVPATAAVAKPVSLIHVRQYERAYGHVAHVFGRRAAGRNIVRDGLSHGLLTDAAVTQSMGVLHRMFDPVPRPAYASRATIASYHGPTVPVAPAGASQTPASGLAACIISHESGGNPQATNGQYAGVGQWSPSAWAQYGGTKYAPSPLGASYAQQVAVLNSEGAAGMQQSQGQYDGC